MPAERDDIAEGLLIQALKELKKPATYSKIIRFLRGTGISERRIQKALRNLVRSGSVIKTDKHYKLAHQARSVTGIFEENPRGYGFLLHESGDVFIPPRMKAGAMNGDECEAVVIGERRGSPEGRIIHILNRANDNIIGVVEESRGQKLLIPVDKRFSRRFVIQRGADYRDGDVVEAVIRRYPADSKDAVLVEPVRKLGRRGERGIDIEIIIRSHGLPTEFPRDVLDEARRVAEIPTAEVQRRRDLRQLFTVTIDGLDARDFDDAVSVEKTPGGFRLWVHIADVSYYVRPGSALDREAQERAFSVYLVDRVIPMLPLELSAGICSLNPHEDRLAVTVEMEIDSSGRVKEAQFYESVIRSDHRLTYEEVDQRIREGTLSGEIKVLIDTMLELREVLEQKRLRRGALDFDIPEAKVLLDENGDPYEVVIRERTLATSIIEEAMIVTNETVAEFLRQKELPALYRVHEKPDLEDVEALKRVLAEMGFASVDGLKPEPHSFQRVVLEARNRPDRILANMLILRSLKKARYAPQPLGHFGLAAENYLHFTSPIRRYPDLVVHRILKEALSAGGRTARIADIEKRLDSIAEHCSHREVEADTAERDSQEVKLYELMQKKHLGDVFQGIISGVTNSGFYVELPNTAEGFVNISELYDDYYVCYPERFEIVGKRTGRVFRVGEVVMVQVVSVSVIERQMKLVMV